MTLFLFDRRVGPTPDRPSYILVILGIEDYH
jgi:hypothetical protein